MKSFEQFAAPGAVHPSHGDKPKPPSFVGRLWLDLTRIDRSQISIVIAVRSAFAMVLPLAVGAAIGHPLAGLTIAIGALNVALSDTSDPYALRTARMLSAAVCGALSVFAGCAAGGIAWLLVIVAALWSAAGGLTVIEGPQAAQVGMVSVILLVVFAAHPQAPRDALTTASFFMAGGLLQILLAIAGWPLRGLIRERQIVAEVLHELADYARIPGVDRKDLPASSKLTEADEILTGITSNFSPGAERLRSILNQAERLRLELAALGSMTAEGSTQHARQADTIEKFMAATARLLDSTGNLLESGDGPADFPDSLRNFEAALDGIRELHRSASAAGEITIALAHAESVRSQISAVAELSDFSIRAGRRVEVASRTKPLVLIDRLSTNVRANLSLKSAAFRHALRLAASVILAEAVAAILATPHGYWIPMTAAIVLKPDYAGTFSRGLARLFGTLFGLIVATLVVVYLPPTAIVYVLLAAVFMFLMRATGAANYMLSVIPLTALIVVLLAFGGGAPGPTIIARGVATMTGGLLALAVYAAWPTWESTQTPLALALVIDAEALYFARVADAYLHPKARATAALSTQRLAARLARANAEASVDRLYADPFNSHTGLAMAVRMLASLHRFAMAVMGLETGLYDGYSLPQPPAAFRDFAAEVERGMHNLGAVLRGSPAPLIQASDLRSLQLALVANRALVSATGQAHAGAAATLIASETDRITNALNTMTHLMRTHEA